ncbi:MAG: hypothetical protein CSA81_14540 [Acidobacteria bacterium]|nr:MAG: hypothetical protein CSA81_14540 [Acidobacteriota bacterium]
MREVFGEADNVYVNNTKSIIGHAMGAAGVLELAGNLAAFEDGIVHPTINIENLDPDCALKNLVINEARHVGKINTLLNNSFGMLGINSTIIVKKYQE